MMVLGIVIVLMMRLVLHFGNINGVEYGAGVGHDDEDKSLWDKTRSF